MRASSSLVLGVLEGCSAHTVAVDLSEDALTSLAHYLLRLRDTVLGMRR